MEWGVFNDEGCTDVFESREEADALAEKYRADDGGYFADLISVHDLCEDHEGQAKDACEECYREA